MRSRRGWNSSDPVFWGDLDYDEPHNTLYAGKGSAVWAITGVDASEQIYSGFGSVSGLDLIANIATARPGDFDTDGALGATDIDLLSAQVRAVSTDPDYDLNGDGAVDDLDRGVWVHELKRTHFGDADLDGEFASPDLVQVLASGQYEDDVALNSTWGTGDWSGDGEFASGDLVLALADGGYDARPRRALAVPAPLSFWLFSLALLFVSPLSRMRG
jgi:hypothetical protein